jgi:hypothetical protein
MIDKLGPDQPATLCFFPDLYPGIFRRTAIPYPPIFCGVIPPDAVWDPPTFLDLGRDADGFLCQMQAGTAVYPYPQEEHSTINVN